jgi:hypothetical protein
MRANEFRRSARERCRAAFAVAALVGGLGILIGISTGLPMLQIAAWCAAVVAGYGVVIGLIGGGQIGPRQAGDALNSLGFVLALAVLTITVWIFAAWPADGAAIIRGFAAALASIGCGYALKVLIQLFRDDPDEIEAGVRLALIEVSRELHVQLLGVLQDVGALRVALAAEIARASAETTAAVRTECGKDVR